VLQVPLVPLLAQVLWHCSQLLHALLPSRVCTAHHITATAAAAAGTQV
jgi:hypothetical protein